MLYEQSAFASADDVVDNANDDDHDDGVSKGVNMF